MKKEIFKLAINTLWCDIRHSCRGVRGILMLCLVAGSIMAPDGTLVLCLAWPIEMAMMMLLPTCGRILFIMPVSAAERKRLMIYRQFAMEAVFIVLILSFGLLRALIFRNEYPFAKCVINNVFTIALMLFEAGSAVFFCGWCKKASIQEKGFGIFFSILAWVIFFTAIALSDNEVEGHEALMLGLGVAGFLVQAFVKMYYMVHAFFAEYKFVDVAGLNGTKNKKTNMADEMF